MPLSEPSPALLAALCADLGDNGWAAPEREPRYLVEPRGWLKGRAAIILKPSSTTELARIVRMCGEEQVGIVPYGGGTGLVGGQIALDAPDPVILSLERMRRIRRITPEDDAIIVEAGCTLAEIRAAAAKSRRSFPLRIASEGTCQIGGALATNAGGMHVLRYGNARELCLGVEAVFADGSIWNGLRTLRKESSGYDLRHLLVGSEGTLGIIAAAALRLFPVAPEEATALVAVPNPEAAAELALDLRLFLAEILGAIELMERSGIEFIRENFPAVSLPLPGNHPWYVMIEVEGGAGSEAGKRLETVLAKALERERIIDAVIAQSVAQRDAIRTIRETIPIANRSVRAIATHDIAVSLERVPEFVREFQRIVCSLGPRFRTNVFGHLGDGNLHANLFPPKGRPASEFLERKPEINGAVFDAVRRLDGAVSAEHGVGRILREATIGHLQPAEQRAMRAIKGALDPLGILNPGAVVDGPDMGVH